MLSRKFLVKTVVGLFLLAPSITACGAHSQQHSLPPPISTNGPNSQDNQGGQNPQDNQGATAVTGTIYWPDGQPAANATVDFYPNGYPYVGTIGGDGEVQGTTDSQGRYAITGCGCTAFGAEYHLDYSRNGGNYCYIAMHADSSYTVSASPGDVVNWTMVDMPCSRVYLNPSDLQGQLALMQAHPEITGGSWQQARVNAGG